LYGELSNKVSLVKREILRDNVVFYIVLAKQTKQNSDG